MKISVSFICLVSIICMAGCASLRKPAPKAPLHTYSGLKAKIAIADFEVNAAKASQEIGSGLRQMLTVALLDSNRFSIVQRQQLSAVTQEQISSSATAEKSAGQAENAQMQPADIIISATVTEFEPAASGGRAGIGGGGGIGNGVLGSLLGGSLNKAHMALDLKIVDASTSTVLAATQVQGQASDIYEGVLEGGFGRGVLGTGLYGYANTPMEKAIRICINEASRYITQTVPESYYKY